MSKVTRDLKTFPFVVNRMRGIVPTFSTFNVNSPTPANMTDGDFTTNAGTASRNLAAPGDIGRMTFDMGAIYNVEIYAWLDIHRDSGDGVIVWAVEVSNDGITYTSGGITLGNISSSSLRSYPQFFVTGRYIRLFFQATGTTVASVYHVVVYEVMALEVL